MAKLFQRAQGHDDGDVSMTNQLTRDVSTTSLRDSNQQRQQHYACLDRAGTLITPLR